MQLLALSGSLRAASSNTVLLRAAAQLAPKGVEVQFYERLGELPHFSPELDGGEVVAELKRAVTQAEGVLFCTPEYVHGLPGSFKNALDWLVSDGELWNKPVAVLSARKSAFAEPQLREVLRTLLAKTCQEASVLVPFATNAVDARAVLADTKLSAELSEAMKVFAEFVRGSENNVSPMNEARSV